MPSAAAASFGSPFSASVRLPAVFVLLFGYDDALALSSADAGIAMGGIGSDIAVESADAVLVSDDIKRLPYLFGLMKKVMKHYQKANLGFYDSERGFCLR